MKFLIIHNQYSQKGGEESVVNFQIELLKEKGHQVFLYTRSYEELNNRFLGKFISIFTSIYNPRSIKDVKKIIKEYQPDVAIIHNVYSIISPAIIPLLKKKNIKVWQIIHNYRLFCPIGIFFHREQICEQCLNKGREWNCGINNCMGNKIQSYAFAFKFFVIRKINYYKYVDRFYVLSFFQKNKFIQNGVLKEKIFYLPNTFKPITNAYIESNEERKTHIGFVGRLTREKGFFDFVDLAKKMPQYKFTVAGNNNEEVMKELNGGGYKVPENLIFKGFLGKKGMQDFYNQCRVIMFLSRWYEGFPMVLIESLYYKTPIIVNDLSVMSEVVKDNVTGFVLKNKNEEYIKQKIDYLFKAKQEYEAMRENCEKEFDRYSPEKYYQRLLKL